MLKTRVLVFPATVQLSGTGTGVALWAVPDKGGEEDDGEDLEEEAQPGEPEPGGDGVFRHVAGYPGWAKPPPETGETRGRDAPGLQTPPAGVAARSCPRRGASRGRKSRPVAGRSCQHGNPGLAAPPARLGIWFCPIRWLGPLCRGSARGFWCQRPSRAGCQRVGVGCGVGEPWLGTPPRFQPFWRFGMRET